MGKLETMMFLKGKFAELIAKVVDRDADGHDAAIAILRILEEKIGEKSSRRIARNEITKYFRELIEGLWEDNLDELFTNNIIWNGMIKLKIQEGRFDDVEETD